MTCIYYMYIIYIPFKACFQTAQFRKPKPRLESEHLLHTVPKLPAEAMQCS